MCVRGKKGGGLVKVVFLFSFDNIRIFSVRILVITAAKADFTRSQI